MADALSIGLTGLLANQNSLNVTGHNIANVNTEGYSRQRALHATHDPQFINGYYYGNGVRISDVQRLYDDLLAKQLRTSITSSSELEVYHQEAIHIDDILASSDVGMDAAFQRFFDAMQGVADDPSSLAHRQMLLDESEIVVDRFHDVNSLLLSAADKVNKSLETVTNDMSVLAANIASLNQRIFDASGSANGQPPNDLMDQRDQAINELSEKIDVMLVAENNGMINVFIGKGQALVLGSQASSVTTAPSNSDPTELDIMHVDANGMQSVMTSQVRGGELNGYLRFREEILDPARNALGRAAIALSSDINTQHQLGLDLNNTAGGLFFNDVTTGRVVPDANNAGTASLQVAVTDSGLLTTSDYLVEVAAGGYNVTRLSDNQLLAGSPYAMPIDLSASEGIQISISAGATAVGDRFLVQPTRIAAGSLDLVISNPEEVAAASGILVTNGAGNTGTGAMSIPSLQNVNAHPVGQLPANAITLTYDDTGATPVFDVTPAAGVTVSPTGAAALSYDPNNDSGGKTFTLRVGTAPDTYDLQFEISGAPANGDTFVIEPNTNSGPADNRNALVMAGLQNLDRIEGSETYQGSNNELVAEVGSRTRYAEINLQAQEGLRLRNEQSLLEVSGVNLDEEAARLIRFQQAYQASAKVITTARSTFDSLLAAL